MQPGPGFFTLIESLEGFKPCPYMDSSHTETIGIGTITYPDGTPVEQTDPCITHDQAIEYLTAELPNYINGVNAIIRSKINQNQFDALLSFTYNEGVNSLKISTLARAININPQDPNIKGYLLEWNKERIDGKLVYSQGLENRRSKEWTLYSS